MHTKLNDSMKLNQRRLALALLLAALAGACDDGATGNDNAGDSAGDGDGDGMGDGDGDSMGDGDGDSMGDGDGDSMGDGDGDGDEDAGEPPPPFPTCPDADGDGHAALSCGGDDCDDGNADISPSQREICDNGVDDDCYRATLDRGDLDGDGYGCLSDCNDSDYHVHPGRPEACGNGIDDDCNPATADLWDADADGSSCADDCDDDDPRVSDQLSEVCGNGLDDDCDPSTADLGDLDGDGLRCDFDCDDANPQLPNASHRCGGRFHYFEDFESGDGGWTAGGTNPSWVVVDQPSDSSMDDPPVAPSVLGTGVLEYYNRSEASYVESPVLDFSGVGEDPVLSFNRAYYFWSGDFAWIEVSIDGGGSWARVQPAGLSEDFYDFLGNPPAFSSSGDGRGWKRARTVLTGVAGEADVRLRFHFRAGGSGVTDGFFVDDILIASPYTDIVPVALSVQETSCAGGPTLEVTLSVEDRSGAPRDNVTVAYRIDGGATVTEVLAPTTPGSTTDHTFSVQADLSAVGHHSVEAWVLSDASFHLQHGPLTAHHWTQPQLEAGDYRESFEADGGQWIAYGQDVSWQRGKPLSDFISGAADGQYAWVTNPYGVMSADEASQLVSPCFDFSQLGDDPILALRLIRAMSTNNAEGAWMELSTDGGANWTLVGDVGEGFGWYNDSTPNARWNGESPEAGSWELAYHALVGASGASAAQLRLVTRGDGYYNRGGIGVDDVRIVGGFVQAALRSIDMDPLLCDQDAGAQVRISIENTGNVGLTNFDVSYTLDGDTPIVERVGSTIAPGDSLQYTFLTPLGTTLAGEHTLQAQVFADSDFDPTNDSLEALLTTRTTISAADYFEDFEADDGGWLPSGELSSWAHDAPGGNASHIAAAYSGARAWVTNPLGNHLNDELSSLTSPCLDLSGYAQDPYLRFALAYDLGYNDTAWVEMSVDGAPFARVGAVDSGYAWYDGDAGSGAGWNDSLGDWRRAGHILTGSAGANFVLLRFVLDGQYSSAEGVGIDDVAIAAGTTDAAIADISYGPELACEGSGLSITVWNGGSAAISDVPVAYMLEGGGGASEVLPGPIAPGASAIHRFSTQPGLGPMVLTALVNLPGDSDASNDLFTVSTEVLRTVSATGYAEDFNQDDGGYVGTAFDTNSDWQWGMPSGSYIDDDADGGGGAWVTNLSGATNNNEDAAVRSPCLDFSDFSPNDPAPRLQLDRILDTEDGYDYALIWISYDGGGSWEELGTQATGTNWYDEFWEGRDPWTTASHPLWYAAGKSEVLLDFTYYSDSLYTYDGFGIDNVAIIP